MSSCDLGELIAQLILLLAFDACVEVSRPCFFENVLAYPVSVRKFLNKLQADAAHLESEKLVMIQCYMTMCVFISHILRTRDYIPNKATLSKLMERGASKLKVNQNGVDLLIPAFKGGVIFGIILVQVKNQEKGNENLRAK